jgi:hypothetical protein
MRRGPPPFGGPTETGLSDAIGVPEGTCICEDCLADFEAIRDGGTFSYRRQAAPKAAFAPFRFHDLSATCSRCGAASVSKR